ELAEKFITHFSRAHLPKSVCSTQRPLLTQEELLQVKKDAIAYPSLFERPWPAEKKSEGPFYFINGGHHFMVCGHRDFPSIVVKFMTPQEAEKQVTGAQKAYAFATSQKSFW